MLAKRPARAYQKTLVLAVQLLFLDEAMVEQLKRQFTSESTVVLRMGASKWGEAMLVIPNEANAHWPNCRETITKVLRQFPPEARPHRNSGILEKIPYVNRP